MPGWTNDPLEGIITLLLTLNVPGELQFAPFSWQGGGKHGHGIG